MKGTMSLDSEENSDLVEIGYPNKLGVEAELSMGIMMKKMQNEKLLKAQLEWLDDKLASLSEMQSKGNLRETKEKDSCRHQSLEYQIMRGMADLPAGGLGLAMYQPGRKLSPMSDSIFGVDQTISARNSVSQGYNR